VAPDGDVTGASVSMKTVSRPHLGKFESKPRHLPDGGSPGREHVDGTARPGGARLGPDGPAVEPREFYAERRTSTSPEIGMINDGRTAQCGSQWGRQFHYLDDSRKQASDRGVTREPISATGALVKRSEPDRLDEELPHQLPTLGDVSRQ